MAPKPTEGRVRSWWAGDRREDEKAHFAAGSEPRRTWARTRHAASERAWQRVPGCGAPWPGGSALGLRPGHPLSGPQPRAACGPLLRLAAWAVRLGWLCLF